MDDFQKLFRKRSRELSHVSINPDAPEERNDFISVYVVPPPLLFQFVFILGLMCLVMFLKEMNFSFPFVSKFLPSSFSSNAPVAVSILVFVIFIWGSQRVGSKHIRRKINQLYLASESLTGVVERTAKIDAFFASISALNLLPEVMVKNNRVGETVVAWHRHRPGGGVPIEHHFEPRLLDEADWTFDDLEQQSGAGINDQSTNPHRTETLLRRRVRRNLKVKFMWIFAGILIFNIIMGGVISYQQGRVSYQLILWTGMLSLYLFGPANTTRLRRGQWLVVPGGLLHRRSRLRDKQVRLHVFDRRRSVLCATELRNDFFSVAIADADRVEKTTITKKELEILLRAWLSPLVPPRVEELSDFT